MSSRLSNCPSLRSLEKPKRLSRRLRVEGKIKELGPLDVERIVKAAIKAQQHEREAQARAEEEGEG
jgi:hypothetical protein